MTQEWAIYDSDVGTQHLQPLIFRFCALCSITRLQTRRLKTGFCDCEVKAGGVPNVSSTLWILSARGNRNVYNENWK
jgi:hypothetical protein